MTDLHGGAPEVRGGLDNLLLGGLILLIATGLGLGVGLYLLPTEAVRAPILAAGVRVGAESAFPVGASRAVHWGDRVVLVVRQTERRFAAVEGVSPLDGCTLAWDAAALRIVSPCSYLVYDLRGNVVAGLTTTPLRAYEVFVRDGIVYVTGR